MPVYVEGFVTFLWTVWVRSHCTHTRTICIQNQFKFVQHSSHHSHPMFPNEIDMLMIIRASSAMTKNVRPNEESLEGEAILPKFHEWAIRCWHGSPIWLMPYLTRRFFSVMNVPCISVWASDLWCSGQRRIPFSCRSWYILHQLLH